jgi:hypothetical protein
MALTIIDDTITSDRSAHTAHAVPGEEHAWEVSWLPGRHLNRNAAITAMVLADVTEPGEMGPGHRLWVHIDGWAAELGLTAGDAISMTTQPPERADKGKSAVPTDPEAAG